MNKSHSSLNPTNPGPDIQIRVDAWQAHIAANWLKSKRVALVLGKTIYLWGVCKDCFLEDDAWVKHEMTHIAQFKKYGYFRFIFLYLIETIKKGYYNNRFEVEAREQENV